MSNHVCRRLILFLDGTWNEDTESGAATNVVQLRERLLWGLNARLRKRLPNDVREYNQLPVSFRKKGVSGLVFDGFEYIVFYDRGVGTGALLDPIKGGMFGQGLDAKIREAYRFLSTWYRPGDEIFVFGFSRGAFTARSLCGYLQAIGLLRCECCTAENEQRAWDYYRTPPGERQSGEWSWFHMPPNGEPLVHDSAYMRVRALGVFDTVGALGVPAEGFRRLNRSKYEFHDTDVNALVDIRLHAVAIDEPRHAFAPSMWTRPKFKRTIDKNSPTEQVWFAGAHSDVGGGYVNWSQQESGLSYLPMAWMIQRLQKLIVETPPIADPAHPPHIKPKVKPDRNAPLPFYFRNLLSEEDGSILQKLRDYYIETQHKPWATLYTVYPRNHRAINQLPLPNEPPAEASGRVPFGDPINEWIHISALQRLNQIVATDRGKFLNFISAKGPYRPHNLIGVIPYLAASYIRNARQRNAWHDIGIVPLVTWKETRLVDWDGEVFDPEDDKDIAAVFKLLPMPEAIGLTAQPAEMEFIRDPRPWQAPVAMAMAAKVQAPAKAKPQIPTPTRKKNARVSR